MNLQGGDPPNGAEPFGQSSHRAAPFGASRPPLLGGINVVPLGAAPLGSAALGANRRQPRRASSHTSAPAAGSSSPALSSSPSVAGSRSNSRTGTRPGSGSATAAAAIAALTRPGARARSESPAAVADSRGGSRLRRARPASGTPTSAGGEGLLPAVARGPVSLTKEALLGATGLQRGGKESVDAFLHRVSHLKLQGQRLGPAFGELLHTVASVSVVYAYDNLLSSLSGIEHLRRLQLLYLQNNRLCSMAGIEALTNLRILHLGNNRLSRIEGLEHFTKLEELHVPNQRPFLAGGGEGGLGSFGGGDALEFCPSSVEAIAYTLTSLSAAGNRLQDVSCLAPLQGLRTLDLSNNDLQQVSDVRPLLSGRFLTKVELTGNPLAINERKHRSMVVLSAPAIEEIDGKAVLPQEKDFVRRLEMQKMKLQAQRHAHHSRQRHGLAASPVRAPMKAGGGSGPLDYGGAPPILQDFRVS